MKTKLLLLAFPVLCFACAGSDSDSANDASGTASPYLAKEVVAVRTLSTDVNYQTPCTILGEELVRSTFNIGEDVELAEIDQTNGCEFEWAGNKVVFAFGGKKPYESIYYAEYTFDKLYQNKPAHSTEMAEKPALSGPAPEGESAEVPANPGVKHDSSTANETSKHPTGVTEVTLTKPAVSTGHFEAVPGIGDKAVWNAAEGAMHVLYNNHIVSVTVETKGKAEVRKEHAQMLAEVLIDKIAENEYTK